MKFVKYIPVEGKIEIGDYFFNAMGNLSLAVKDTWSKITTEEEAWATSKWKKVKPFLCTDDIQNGDVIRVLQFNGDDDWYATFNREDYNNHCICNFIDAHNNSEFGVPKDGILKVLGEIDPHSTVQDGEEIEEERIVELDICPNYGGRHLWTDCSCKMGFVKGYHIRKK